MPHSSFDTIALADLRYASKTLGLVRNLLVRTLMSRLDWVGIELVVDTDTASERPPASGPLPLAYIVGSRTG